MQTKINPSGSVEVVVRLRLVIVREQDLGIILLSTSMIEGEEKQLYDVSIFN